MTTYQRDKPMRQTISQRFIAVIVMVALALLAVAVGGCRGGAASVAATPTPMPASGQYWALVQRAQAEFAAADFAGALATARQAIALDPSQNTGWALYRQASVAQAADAYLSTLPQSRYRLPVDVFVRDRVNHTKEWVLIDVREPDEFAAGHIEGAINIPLRQLLHHLNELPSSKTAPILVYCHSQKRATHALVILHELGYLKAYNLEGGYEAYVNWMKTHALPTPGPTPTPAPDEPDYGC